MSSKEKEVRKRIQAARKFLQNQKSNLSPEHPYYWQWRAYMALIEFKN